MSFQFTQVHQFKRGARWPDGQPRMCTSCGWAGSRRRQAVVTALLGRVGSKTRTPVSYCPAHVPSELGEVG